MLAMSRQFWATPLRRREERVLTFLSPESLGLGLPLLLRADQGSCSLNFAVDTRSHHPSLRYVLPALLLRTPHSSGRQAAHSSARFLSSLHRMTRAHLHNGLAQLRVIPVLAQHQIQPRGQLARHRYFRQPAMLAHRQPTIKTAQLGIVARRRLSRFHQQEAQKRTALLADVSQLLPPAAGVFARDQPEVAAYLAPRFESLRRPQRQHYGQRRHRPHSRMRHQAHRRRPLLDFCFHLPVQRCYLCLQPVECFQQPLAPDCGIGQQLQLLQLRPSGFRPQLAFLLHSLAQRQCMQLVLAARPRLHLLVPMHQQLPRVPLLQRRHPDPRKAIFPQQHLEMLRVPPVGFLLAHYRGTDFGRIPQPQLQAQIRQQPLEPGIVPASFHPHSHLLPRQGTVKLLRFLAVTQPFFLILPCLIVKDRDLLKSRMKITAYNQHDVGSFSVSLWSFRNLLMYSLRSSQRRYAIKRREAQPNAVEGPHKRWQRRWLRDFF